MRSPVCAELNALTSPVPNLFLSHQCRTTQSLFLVPPVRSADVRCDDKHCGCETVTAHNRQRIFRSVGVCIIKCDQHRLVRETLSFRAPSEPVANTDSGESTTFERQQLPFKFAARNCPAVQRARLLCAHVVIQEHRQPKQEFAAELIPTPG